MDRGFDSWRRWFLDVLLRDRTYLNLVYLALSFPLSLLFFVLVGPGMILGAATSIAGSGAPRPPCRRPANHPAGRRAIADARDRNAARRGDDVAPGEAYGETRGR